MVDVGCRRLSGTVSLDRESFAYVCRCWSGHESSNSNVACYWLEPTKPDLGAVISHPTLLPRDYIVIASATSGTARNNSGLYIVATQKVASFPLQQILQLASAYSYTITEIQW